MNPVYTVLLVDDEPDILASLDALLRRDYRILKATSGRAALDLLNQEHVDVVLTDQRMPDMSGIELLKHAHSAHREVVRLLMTGYADLPTMVDAINVGSVYRYVPKPWEPEELQCILHAACLHHETDMDRKALAARSGEGSDRHALRRIRQVLGSRRALSNVLQVVAKHVLRLFHAKTCEIYLLNTDKTRFVLDAVAHEAINHHVPSPSAVEASAQFKAFDAGATLKNVGLETLAQSRVMPLESRNGDNTVCVPLSFKGSREGVMLVRLESGRELTGEKLVMLETIGAETAAAIMDAHLREEGAQNVHIKRALAQAALLQRNMIPQKPVKVPNFDIAAIYQPKEGLAGDFYDLIDLPPGNLGIAVCDVIDKGVRASLLMAAIRASLRAHATNVYDMCDVLAKVNWDLCAEAGDGDFASMFYGVLNYLTRHLTFCTAGHCPGIMVHAATGAVRNLGTDGIVLGVNPGARYAADTVILQPGDVVAVYTDGLVEAANPERQFYGYEHLGESLAEAAQEETTAEGISQRIIEDIRGFTRGLPQSDDRTLVVIRAT
jgi:phosphoserine phosphatase RsbU/P